MSNENIKGFNVEINQDEYCENPRQWDNVGIIYSNHKRYNLSDDSLDNDYAYSEKTDEFSDSWDEIEQNILFHHPNAVVLPVFMYEHGGITINTSGFSSGWDSGQIGFIFCPLDKIRSEFSVKRVSKKLRSRIEGYLINEIESYDDYLTGNCYGYSITDESGEIVDSCYGFLGCDHKKSGLMENVNNAIDWQIKENLKDSKVIKTIMTWLYC